MMFGVGALLALASAPGQATRPRSRAQILLPTRGSTVCAGTTLLSGQELTPGLRTHRERAAWSYAAGGPRFTTASGRRAPSAPLDTFLYQRLWDTSRLPSGPVALRLRLGNPAVTTRFRNDLPPTVSLLQARPVGGQIELAVDASD